MTASTVPAPPADLPTRLDRAYAAAAKLSGEHRHTLRPAGLALEASFAGQELHELLAPALLHAATDITESDAARLRVWSGDPDDAETRLISRLGGYAPDAEIRLRTDDYLLSYRENLGILTAWCPWTRTGHVRILPSAVVPAYEKGCPMRTFFHWWLRESGLTLVHAGAVGRQGRGVLLAGKAGLGKSTCAFACLRAGLDYTGDDFTAVSLAGGAVEARALYGSVKLESAHLRAIASGMPLSGEALGNGKELLFVDRVFEGRLASRLAVKAVLVPRRTGYAETTVRRISAVRCLTALAPSTIFQLNSRSATDLGPLAEIVRRLPCYVIEMGRDIADIPKRIGELLGTGSA
ncbi:MAG: hypothetical protein MOGMAGMI_01676 [Candidatus Omnitrophica bacterium]|nr:hypothetical protein [Candidatus Omnitrophota bacterium]